MGQAATKPHIPVLLDPILKAAAPISGRWLDGTFGAGGYTRALLDAGAASVVAVDRDPLAFEMAASWADAYEGRLIQQQGVFSKMDDYAQENAPRAGSRKPLCAPAAKRRSPERLSWPN